jgi:hypothetical protein
MPIRVTRNSGRIPSKKEMKLKSGTGRQRSPMMMANTFTTMERPKSHMKRC